MLAYHYVRALELAEAAGDSAQVRDLTVPAARFLVRAGERALGLDAAHAEARLSQALALMPETDPARSDLLVLWADAAFQAGHSTEAAGLSGSSFNIRPLTSNRPWW